MHMQTTQTRFTVLIERRRSRDWTNLAWSLMAITMLAFLLASSRVHAAPAWVDWSRGKVARDLQDAIDIGGARGGRKGHQKQRWVRDSGGKRQVQVIVTSNGKDGEFADLRRWVLRNGGSVHARHGFVSALTVQIPADKLEALTARADVVNVSPNRSVQRTASALEAVSGVLTGTVRSYSSSTSYTGLDGSGVGIAVLDSGVMAAHQNFQNAGGASRVVRNVNMLNARLSDWLAGVDSSISPAPGSAALASYEAALAADSGVLTHDGYGHGTHVASVAAGRGFYQSNDSTGVAPNASIYDIRVLDNDGQGTLSDVLEGISWAIFHAKEYNIRVLNLSLASSSGESWQTDPLCVAVRRAAAAGLTVVVAAGNFGQAKNGAEIYGTISSPGNDPSVITVGAVNYKGTNARSDDSVNLFSSRGPTRGVRTTAGGVRLVDNLLKPDLVAPGNKILGAAATAAQASKPP
jgi:serine protease AprX